MLPAALGGVGQEQLNNNFPPQKIWAKPPPLLKLWRAVGCGGNESVCPACSSVPKAGWEWESVSAIPASAGRQNRKIFVSLIEKNLGADDKKM